MGVWDKGILRNCYIVYGGGTFGRASLEHLRSILGERAEQPVCDASKEHKVHVLRPLYMFLKWWLRCSHIYICFADPGLKTDFEAAWRSVVLLTEFDENKPEISSVTCCEYLRVARTQKNEHARSGELFKRYGAIFKSQLKTLLDFWTAFKSTAAAGTRSSSKSHAYSSSVVAVDRNADDNDYEESWYGCHLLLKSVICNNWRQECVTFYKYVEIIP